MPWEVAGYHISEALEALQLVCLMVLVFRRRRRGVRYVQAPAPVIQPQQPIVYTNPVNEKAALRARLMGGLKK